jgi:hypothetical protein
MAKQYMFDFSHFFCNHPVYDTGRIMKDYAAEEHYVFNETKQRLKRRKLRSKNRNGQHNREKEINKEGKQKTQ